MFIPGEPPLADGSAPMGESWRTSVRSLRAHRRSAEDATERRSRRAAYDPADDFRDVFGGPPRSVLLRRFSGAEIPAFLSGARPAPSTHDDSSKPPVAAKRVQVRTEPGFYDDIFGSDGSEWRPSRSRSKSRVSPLVLSSEHVNAPPLSCASMGAENVVLSTAPASSFSYKLRQINIPPRNQKSPSPPSAKSKEACSSSTSLIALRDPSHSCFLGFKHLPGHEKGSSGDMLGLSRCSFLSSPETFSLESSFRGNQAKPLPWELSEPEEESTTSSSVMSPVLFVEAERVPRCVSVMMEVEGEEEEEEDAEGSFVMEFHDAAGSDEAITWAKDKLWNQF